MEKRSLLLIRHAKSSWDNFSGNDFDRSLNERGKRDAPLMAARVHKNIQLDAIITSPAKRALTTARFFAQEFHIKNHRIAELDYLYDAPVNNFFTAVENLSDEYKNVALFSHNPGITAFVNMLTNTRIDNMPTCAIFALHIHTDAWKEFRIAKKEFWFFEYPKNFV
ncbi:MAG: histidine phosphatase family protein [Bacteroidetes bacterium]|nr:histidine phosphatase family protein [Bacteroidota bacterium]